MNAPYFLIPISLAIILYYLLDSLMAEAGVISKAAHLRFWNFALLFVFLGCAVLGILLTININYKLEWHFVDDLLSWHVQLGIAMSMVAFIHTFLHLDYFSKYLSFRNLKARKTNSKTKHQLLASAFALGLLSISLQVLLIRQFTKVFQGNEFLVTWIIGIWMLLSGAGAITGSGSSAGIGTDRTITKTLWYMFGSAVLFIFISGEICQTFFPSGVLIPPQYVLILVTLMMAPSAFPSGMIYSMLTNRLKNEYQTIYAYEALGSLTGGLMLSLVIIWFLNTYLAVIAIGFTISLILLYPPVKSAKLLVPVILLVAGIGIKVFNIDILAEGKLMHGQKVLSVTDSPYGTITVTGSEEQINFFGNGTMLFGTQNTIYCEELVHYAMAQRANPKRVLLVSGGYAGLTDELKKYNRVEVDYVEPNRYLLRKSKQFCNQELPQTINEFNDDIRDFLRKSSALYDIAIITTPEPTSLDQNRYFTLEFLNLLKKHLTDSGVVCYSLAGIGNYPSQPKQKAYSSMVATLISLFKNVEMIAGERDYLLASDSTIRIDMSHLLRERDIGNDNQYIRPDFINDHHIAERNQFFHSSILLPQKLNTDNHPWPVMHNTLGYLSMFGNRMWLLLTIGAALLTIPFLIVRSNLRSMYVVGFAGSAIQTLYLLTLQISAGILYGALGAIIALFMGGLALGAMMHGKQRFVNFNHAKILLVLAYVILIALWFVMKYTDTWLLIAILCVGTLMASFAVGFLYVHISSNSDQNINLPAKTYATDLWGSAAGIVIVTLLLIPSIGIVLTTATLAMGIGIYLIFN